MGEIARVDPGYLVWLEDRSEGRPYLQEIDRMRKDAVLWVAVIANTFFWFLGAILLLNIVLYATDILRVDEAHSSLHFVDILSAGPRGAHETLANVIRVDHNRRG